MNTKSVSVCKQTFLNLEKKQKKNDEIKHSCKYGLDAQIYLESEAKRYVNKKICKMLVITIRERGG